MEDFSHPQLYSSGKDKVTKKWRYGVLLLSWKGPFQLFDIQLMALEEYLQKIYIKIHEIGLKKGRKQAISEGTFIRYAHRLWQRNHPAVK